LWRKQEFVYHSSPLESDLGDYGRLLDIICKDIPNLPRIPHYIKEGAKKIIKIVRNYYPTQGRRRTAIIIVAIGIARGDHNINLLKDLRYRVKHLTGEEIPEGQVHNTFEELQTFLKNLPIYKLHRRKHVFKLKPEEKIVLRKLKTKTSHRERSFLTA